jgi:hypothetical protein
VDVIRWSTLQSPHAIEKSDIVKDFRAFSDLAEQRACMLPKSWIADWQTNRNKVITMGSKEPHSWFSLESTVEPKYVVQRNGDQSMVGRLRRSAVWVYDDEVEDRSVENQILVE